MSTELTPLGDRVIIKKILDPQTTKSGIIIPDAVHSKQKPLRGTVVYAGPGKPLDNGTFRPIGVQVGQEIIFASYAGTDIKVDGEELMVLNSDDIMCTVSRL